MTSRLLKVIILSLLLFGCKFKVSPYEAKTPDINRNQTALNQIRQQELTTPPDFKIAMLSDTHNYYGELDKAIDYINANGPYAFVVINGDITNYGLLEEFQESLRFFNKLVYPFLVVVGNHDLLANGDTIYDKMFGQGDFSFTYHDVRFVLFNNNNWEARGAVPDSVWIESVLTADTSSRRVLVAHVAMDDMDRFTSDQIATWAQLVQDYQVDYVINGHNHNPQVGTFGGATQVTIGAPSKKVFYELIFSAGGVTHQKISF